MKQFLSVILATVALTATAFAQDEGDALPAGTRTAAFVVVQAQDGTRSAYKVPAEAIAAGREAVMAAATPENLIEVTPVADEGDLASSRSAWFWCWNTFSFGWGGWNTWYQPVYSWNYGFNNYWAYRWVW